MREKRAIVRKVRLTKEEDEMFRKKAKLYHSIASMVRDAVTQYDDVLIKGKIDVLKEILVLYKKYQQDLGWYGSNLNQAMHQANSLALAGKLSGDYMNNVILPKIIEAISLLRDVKDEQTEIYRKLLKL